MFDNSVIVRLVAAGAALAAAIAGPVLLTPSSGATAVPREGNEPPSGATDLTGLRVLVTNDDSAQGHDLGYGTDGKGLYELRQALCAAGADVLVVAPWSQQSGASARMTTPGFAPVSLTVEPVTPPAPYADDCAGTTTDGAVVGVCLSDQPCSSGTPSASPADAVRVGVTRFAANFWPEGPDVVLSGVNFGQNVGTTVNHSGTVGAVVTAAEFDLPALALSAEVPIDDLSQIPDMPFDETADVAVDLLGALVARDRLEPGVVLNVNHPFVGAEETLGRPVAAVVGDTSDLGVALTGDVPAEGGTYRLGYGAPTEQGRRDADTVALARNDIPVTSLDGDWGAPHRRGLVTSLLEAVD